MMPAACTITSPNVKAFLKLLRYAENMPRDDDEVYYRLFGGGTFTDSSKHPNRLVKMGGYSSTAAGAYQILFSTWLEAKKFGIASDFSPASQDAIAFSKIESRGALGAVCAGKLADVIPHLRNEWVSLPEGSQSHLSMSIAQDRFQKYQEEFAR